MSEPGQPMILLALKTVEFVGPKKRDSYLSIFVTTLFFVKKIYRVGSLYNPVVV